MAVEDNIPEGWVKSSIGELTYFVGEKISPTELTVYNYISTENLLSDKKGVVVSSNLPNVSKVNEFRIGDTLFSNIRTYFKKVWQANINGGSSNDVLIFRPLDESQLNKSYLYRIISSDLFIDFTVKTAKGTKMPRGDKNAMRLFPVNLPPLLEQKAIAKVLTAFDDKIELLQAQNKTLETMAQTVFKEWFGKYQAGDEMPEGWIKYSLGELVEIINGYSYKGKELVENSNEALVSLKSFDRNGGFQTRGFKPFLGNPKPEQEVKIGDLVVAHTDLTQDAEVLGNPAFIFDNGGFEQMYITMDLVKVVSKHREVGLSFLYYLMKDRYFKGHCIGYSNGTTVLHLSKKAIPEYELYLPTDFDLIQRFTKIADDTTNKISLNIQVIKTLTKTRDTLLPKLMSGQVRVKNIKQTADA